MTSDTQAADWTGSAVAVTNPLGQGRTVLVCDHASNFLPPQFGTLGLDPSDLTRHIAWDPGAAPVARLLAGMLDAPLVESRISRLVIDCNRPADAPDLIWTVSEETVIPGNQRLAQDERARRIQLAWTPFHAAIERLVTERLARGLATILVSVHSFTPVYRGVQRPWHVGVLHDDDERVSRPLLTALDALPGIVTGDNQPYSPADRVYYTLERHARSRGLPCAMIEIRNDEIADGEGQVRWASRLGTILRRLQIEETSVETQEAEGPKFRTMR